MLTELTNLYASLKLSPNAALLSAEVTLLLAIVVISVVVNFILKQYIVYFVHRLLKRSKSVFAKEVMEHNLFRYLSHIGPGLVIYFLIPMIDSNSFTWINRVAEAIQRFSLVYMLLAVMVFITVFLSVVNHTYKQFPYAKRHPIRGYLAVAKIFLWSAAAILAISILVNKSPWAFLTGLGAISAVLLLVFKDTIMGFVASIQVSAYDMVRVGDWIQMDSMGANGDVIEVSINTVKVRNFDNTIVTVPTYALISKGVINWRGMSESGGRRIKRSINIDMDTVHFADHQLVSKLKELRLFKKYVDEKSVEIEDFNKNNAVSADVLVDGRHFTNIGLFRAYAQNYLENHPKIHKEMTLMVRQLQSTQNGIPVQLYVFTNDVNWVHYEDIQADIFDHLIAALPLFELRAFQSISGRMN